MEHVANYPVIRKLGEGATSEVFLCQDPFRGREVAVKRIFPEALRDPMRGRVFRKLFFTEASLAGKLEHPHIAQIFDAGIGEDSGYIVMEYVPGGTMERFCTPESLLPVEQVLEIAFKCARALSFAHARGVTHRDIKPGNILYATEPTDVRIGDFGLAINMISRAWRVILRHVACRVLSRQQAVDIVEPPDQAVELRPQRRLHLMRNARERVSARTRPSSPAASLSACVGACNSLAVSPCDSASSTAAGSSPRCRQRSARSSSWRRACSPWSRSARMSGTFSRACIQRMRGSSPGPQVPPCRGFSFLAARRRARSLCE